MTLPLQTQRLIIRQYRRDDLDDVAAVLGDPRVFWWLPRPFDRRQTRSWLAEEMTFTARHGTGRYAVVLRATGRVIGGIALIRREMSWGAEDELGYHLASREWGNGYATEAGLAMLGEAYARGLRRVVAFIMNSNQPSLAVARRLGMSYERDIEWAGQPHQLWAVALAARGGAAIP